MTTKTSARAALILAFSLLVGFAGPSLAQSADNAATDNANVAAPANPADPQAAPATQAAGTDKLGDADRAPRQDDVKAPVVVTQTETPARTNAVVAGSQNASWDETSLIGKIFIGFGALLTIASAARMFMA
jgi:hypothetical protein